MLGAVVPGIHHAVHLAVKLDLDLLVALADGGRFELSHALFEIGAAISPEIHCLGLAAYAGQTADGVENRGNGQPPCYLQSPSHDTPLFWLFEFRHLKLALFVPVEAQLPHTYAQGVSPCSPAGRILALSRVSLGDQR